MSPASRAQLAALSCLLLAMALPSPARGIEFRGVNLASGEFGPDQLPGTYGLHYTYPISDEVDYFLGKGANTVRVPFRWERLQQNLLTPLDATELARLDAIVSYATAQGVHVVLDPHNYARYHGEPLGSPLMPDAVFADFWSRLADVYKDDPLVIFGLMTEPNQMDTEDWVSAANAAIAAIRDTGATNLILVPGNGWTASDSWYSTWYGTSNATAMHAIHDPGDHYAFEVHTYLDLDASGHTPDILYPTVGSDRLLHFTQWLRQYGYKGFLAEFAVAAEKIGPGEEQIGDEAIHDTLGFIHANDDVFLGWTWWAAGPWWGNYMFSLEPENLAAPDESDALQMPDVEPYLLPEPVGGLAAGALLVGALGRLRRARLQGRHAPTK